jgi:hypothetical protein
MKSFIILCSTILLGMAIYNMIMGPSEDSLLHVVTEVWKNDLVLRTNLP